MDDRAEATIRKPQVPPLIELFLVCMKIGLLSFGGGLAGWMHQEFVVRRSWVNEEDFLSGFTVSQMLPGANVVNLLIFIGSELRGAAGALVCVTGFLIGPFFVIIAIGELFRTITDSSLVGAITDGVAFTALGLFLVICVNGVRRSSSDPAGLLTIVAIAVAVGLLQWSILLVVLVAAPISVAIAWRRVD